MPNIDFAPLVRFAVFGAVVVILFTLAGLALVVRWLIIN